MCLLPPSDLLKKTDEQIIALLEEKVKVFRDMCNYGKNDENPIRATAMFHTSADDSLKGDHIMQDTLKEGGCGQKHSQSRRSVRVLNYRPLNII